MIHIFDQKFSQGVILMNSLTVVPTFQMTNNFYM